MTEIKTSKKVSSRNSRLEVIKKNIDKSNRYLHPEMFDEWSRKILDDMREKIGVVSEFRLETGEKQCQKKLSQTRY